VAAVAFIQDLTLAADVHLAYNNFDHGAILVAVSLCLSGDNLICVDIVSPIGFLVLLRACHKPIKVSHCWVNTLVYIS